MDDHESQENRTPLPGHILVRRKWMPPTKDRGWQCEHSLTQMVPIEDDAGINWKAVLLADAELSEAVEAECARRDASEGRPRRFFS